MARSTLPHGNIRSANATGTRNATLRATILILASLFAGLLLAGCRGKQVTSQGPGSSAEPDKVLYERGVADIQRKRFEEARLALQTLINTYPDSEYLAKAKLGIADSYFQEGGPTALTQAIAEYQDFLTFFPFLDEAAYAQLQIGMAHYRQMAKPDRDRNDTLEAEGALQTFLQKYPTSPLYSEAQQRLREVQEVIAEGDFRVANFYYLRGTTRASAARLFELVNRYPLYSQADKANWMLANLAERGERNDVAGQYYAVIVKNYPLSALAKDARTKLEKFGVPVPQPDSTAMARMQTEQQLPRKRGGILSMPLGMLKSSPDVSMAARTGAPTLTPRQVESGDVMAPGGATSLGTASSSSGPGLGAVVETVTPGSGNGSGSSPATPTTPAAGSTVPPPPTATTGDVPAAPAATTESPTTNGAATATPASTGESSSKKKKGLRKIIPW